MKVRPDKRWVLAIVMLPLLAIALFSAFKIFFEKDLQEGTRKDGLIRLSDVGLIQDRGRYFLDANAQIELPATIKAGLDSGVPLVFVLTLKLLEPSRYGFDKQLDSIEHRFSLTYYELTRHYRVRRLSTNTHRNYRSLSSALRGLGTIENLPLMVNETLALLGDSDTASIAEIEAIVAVLDFRLDSRSLPLPLQPVITSRWRLASKELRWLVN